MLEISARATLQGHYSAYHSRVWKGRQQSGAVISVGLYWRWCAPGTSKENCPVCWLYMGIWASERSSPREVEILSHRHGGAVEAPFAWGYAWIMEAWSQSPGGHRHLCSKENRCLQRALRIRGVRKKPKHWGRRRNKQRERNDIGVRYHRSNKARVEMRRWTSAAQKSQMG